MKLPSALVIIAIVITVTIFLSCSGGNNESNSTKYQQYYVQGQKLYTKHCSNCHQTDGSGLKKLYPPLNRSDYMDKNFNEVICLIRNGKSGPIDVNGILFNQPMPGIPRLTDLEIAEIATYIYNSWDHNRGLISVTDVRSIRETCPN